MATGTQNPKAGEYPLDSAPKVLVSVPPQCVGAHRCPLFVMLPGGGISAREMTDWLHPVADKYGMILLAPTNYEKNIIDAALKETLRRFAIDPDKIAIIGRCLSGVAGMSFGIDNLDVFSRIASISGGVLTSGMDPKNKTVEFLIDAGFLESDGNFKGAQILRREGHPVKLIIGLRDHEHQIEDYDFLGRWLQESWAKPNPATRTAPSVVADPVPVLTTDVLTQMTTFWTNFLREPDSIRTTARRAHLREVIVPVGQERPSIWMVDMAALAAKYPSVAADLKTAGLTAQQHDAYRVALISAQVSKSIGKEAGTVEATSALAKNVEFFDAHPDEFKALARAGIEHPEKLEGLGGTISEQISMPRPNPNMIKTYGAMGIWRTP
jgi:hypothetical protein